MTRMRWLVVVVGWLAIGCGGPPTSVLFEPGEKVVGRARDLQRVRLLTTARRLVTVHLSDLSMTSSALVGLKTEDEPWGLAVSDARWWTLVGASQLAQIGDEGHLGDRVPLDGSYVGLFGLDETMLLQPASPAPGAPVLQILNLKTMGRQNAGALRASTFGTRAETLALNLVACGSTESEELPCWFNHSLQVDRIGSAGGGRIQAVSGIELAPDTRIGLERIETSGPLVDAHIDQLGRLWVLLRRSTGQGRGQGTGQGARQANDERESVLARYGGDRLEGVVRVPSLSRLIIDVRDDACVVLVGSGQLSTVGIP